MFPACLLIDVALVEEQVSYYKNPAHQTDAAFSEIEDQLIEEGMIRKPKKFLPVD
jgi:hypothetical protein